MHVFAKQQTDDVQILVRDLGDRGPVLCARYPGYMSIFVSFINAVLYAKGNPCARALIYSFVPCRPLNGPLSPSGALSGQLRVIGKSCKNNEPFKGECDSKNSNSSPISLGFIAYDHQLHFYALNCGYSNNDAILNGDSEMRHPIGH